MPVINAVSPEARAIASLFDTLLIVCAVLFIIVAGSISYIIFRYRGRPDAAEPVQIHGNARMEIIWTVIPFLVLVWIFVETARAMSASDPQDPRKPDLVIISHQWWWEVRYPGSGAVAANEIHIPVGQRWRVLLDSGDVIHDFWVPELGRKMDMVPGHPNSIWLNPSRPGTYLGTCSEYCGTQHAWMRLRVIAQPLAEFKAWEDRQVRSAAAPPSGHAGEGLNDFKGLTCLNCHTISGVNPQKSVGPDLTHLASRNTLGAGVLSNSPDTLARWLKNPQAIKPGCHMPNLKLSDDQVNALVAYFETLR